MYRDMEKWWSCRSRPVWTCAAAVLTTGVITFGQAPPAPTPESVKRADEVLAAARKALGGEKLSEVKTVVATGRTRRVRGDNLVPIEFQLLLELPDKFVRVDEFPAEDTDPTSAGFNGDALIQNPPAARARSRPRRTGRRTAGSGTGPGWTAGATGGCAGARRGQPANSEAGRRHHRRQVRHRRSGAPPTAVRHRPERVPHRRPVRHRLERVPRRRRVFHRQAPLGRWLARARGMMPPGGRGPAMDPRRARLVTVKQDYARLALGLFAASSGYPLTFSYAAIAEAPQGRADVLDVKGEGNFQLRYFINSETHLPVMVTWTTPPTNVIVTVPGQPPPKSVAPGAVVVAGPAAPPAGAPKEEMDKYAKEVARAARESTGDAGRAPAVFRGLSRRRGPEAAVQAASRDRDRNHRGNHLRSVSDEYQDRPQEIRSPIK